MANLMSGLSHQLSASNRCGVLKQKLVLLKHFDNLACGYGLNEYAQLLRLKISLAMNAGANGVGLAEHVDDRHLGRLDGRGRGTSQGA